MSSERIQIKRLFDAVIAAGAEHRQALLEAVEPSVRERVETLLAAQQQSGDFSQTQPGSADQASVEQSTSASQANDTTAIPERIGPYRIVRKIGEGGMGVVYEAEQDKPVRRKVALKIVKRGMDTRQVIARFDTERQALALMNHPNIASVYDAGATDNGRPYFAMEYVRGIRITEYCDKHRLSIAERMNLFVQVCDGVQHAHQKAIIHRDIKPSNVLIAVHGDKAVPKLIDFGVAKATSQRLTEHSVYTELGQLIGTPEYMSPEQAEMTNLDIDTRTDVYSLGVLFYELLVGAQPFDSAKLRKAGLGAIQRMLRDEEPPRPSARLTSLGGESTTSASQRRTDPGTLARQLKGDLDWICMKAMEKDRTRRYETVNALAMDVGRYLNGESVRARPPSTSYRMGKFVRRHRLGVAAAAIVTVALLLGIAGTTAGMIRATTAERIAATEAAKANSINEFLLETLGSADPWQGNREVTILEALGKSVQNIDSAFHDQPIVAAAVRRTIGKTYSNLGDYEQAAPLLESAFDARVQMLGAGHPDAAEILADLGELSYRQGNYEKAQSRLREAAEIRRALGDPRATGEVLNMLAETLWYQGDFEAAESVVREALDMLQEAFGERSVGVAASLYTLSSIYMGTGRYQEAMTLASECLDIRRELLGSNHPDVAATLNQVAVVAMQQGDLTKAETYYQESLRVNRDIFGEQHPEIATTLENLGGVYMANKRYGETLELLDEVLAMRRAMLGDDHTAVGRTFFNMGVVNYRAGDLVAAEEAYREGMRRLESTLGADHPDVGYTVWTLGMLLQKQGALAEAGKAFARCLEIFSKLFDEDHQRVVGCRVGEASVLVSEGKSYERAERLLLSGYSSLDEGLGSKHRDTQYALEWLVKLYEGWDKPDRATQFRATLDESQAQ